MVTTAKDAVKLAPLLAQADQTIWSLEIELQFAGDDAERLIALLP